MLQPSKNTYTIELHNSRECLLAVSIVESLESRVENNNGDSSPSLIDYPSECTEFDVVIPTISFFKLSLQPAVYAIVQPDHNQMVITSTQCVPCRSSFIEKVKNNHRFNFSVNTTLAWNDNYPNQAWVNLEK